VTDSVPVVVPAVNVTEQVALVDNVQLAPIVLPVAVPVMVKLTVPVGVFDGVVVSATVAVQLEVPVGTIVAGLQATDVEVASFALTVILAAVALVLVACCVSPL
jgi:hypothetical protein